MFKNLKILVIGDLMLDHYIWGDATRISPEAPVPVVGVERDSYVPGGAANVACNLSGLGVQTALLGAHGADEGGIHLEQLLTMQGIRLCDLGRKNVKTIVKTRVVVQRQQICRIDREEAQDCYALSGATEAGELENVLAGVDAVIVSDYAKGVIDQKLLSSLRAYVERQSRSILLVVDPKPKRKLDLSGMDLMTPNRTEALQLAGMPMDHNAEFDDALVCKRIYEVYAPQNLVITLGAEGMLLCHNGKILGRLPTEAREVFDVSGAGDTVVATLTAALAAGQPLEDAAKLANKAAGIVVSHLGTSPIQAADLLAEL